MPQPNQPRQFGAPTGVQKPITQGRQQPQGGDPSAYIKHMIDADKQYHAKGGGGSRPVQGSYGGLSGMLAKGKPPVGIGGKAREGTINSAVQKAGG
jgi:hypothetical protein